uniref:RNA helicase n=1 Tax=Octactis speculum TaxID=3111310 RepID=A0A7S2B9U3_9STRA
MGYKVPTPVQRKTMPLALGGKDVVCMARTGSGKTAAFLVPLLESLKEHRGTGGTRAIVLSPTRELALQTLRFSRQMAKYTDLRAALIVGGDSMEGQFEALANQPDFIIATPGRLAHHLEEVHDFTLQGIQFVVFDEADRLFEMGFAHQLQQLLHRVPENRQTLLFSATMPKVLIHFARAGLSDPQLIRLETDTRVPDELRLAFFTVRSFDKPCALVFVMRELLCAPRELTVIFSATRHHCEMLRSLLAFSLPKLKTALIYGTMDQEARKTNLDKFRKRQVTVLLVTDVAARGIDIPLLDNVVNYSFPPTPKLFVHRVGRTARQGRSGTAISLVDPEEMAYMTDLHLFLGKKMSTGHPDKDEEEVEEVVAPSPVTAYSLKEMDSKSMVHYGCIPQPHLDAEQEVWQRLLTNEDDLANLNRVCTNASKQYKRTRPDPSSASVRRAKALEMHHIHPLLLSLQDKHHALQTGASSNRTVNPRHISGQAAVDTAEYLHSLTKYRPKATVFEVDAKSASNAAETGLDIMRRVRHSHKVHKGLQNGLMMDAGQGAVRPPEENSEVPAETTTGKEVPVKDEQPLSSKAEEKKPAQRGEGEEEASCPKEPKRRMSRAERKRKKSGIKQEIGTTDNTSTPPPASTETTEEEETPRKRVRKRVIDDAGSFRDKDYFIAYQNVKESQVEGMLGNAPSKDGIEALIAGRLEESLLDVNPDNSNDLYKKQKLFHWDKRHNKYIRSTLSELNESSGVKLRSESGTRRSTKSKNVAGEIYDKWKKRTQKTVASEPNNMETADTDTHHTLADRMPLPVKKNDRHVKKVQEKADRAETQQGRNGKAVADELKTEAMIRKERKVKENLRLKNMSKGQRAHVVKKMKEEKRAKKNLVQSQAVPLKKKQWQRGKGGGGQKKK